MTETDREREQREYALHIWKTKACAPLVTEGPALAAAKRMLLARALELGHVMSDEPNLRVLADGGELAAEVAGQDWRVKLPPEAREVRFVSPHGVPAQLNADSDDHRPLGLAIAGLELDGAAPAEACYGPGWHPAEAAWRWTNGDATLVVIGARELSFRIALAAKYWKTSES